MKFAAVSILLVCLGISYAHPTATGIVRRDDGYRRPAGAPQRRRKQRQPTDFSFEQETTPRRRRRHRRPRAQMLVEPANGRGSVGRRPKKIVTVVEEVENWRELNDSMDERNDRGKSSDVEGYSYAQSKGSSGRGDSSKANKKDYDSEADIDSEMDIDSGTDAEMDVDMDAGSDSGSGGDMDADTDGGDDMDADMDGEDGDDEDLDLDDLPPLGPPPSEVPEELAAPKGGKGLLKGDFKESLIGEARAEEGTVTQYLSSVPVLSNVARNLGFEQFLKTVGV